MPNYTDTDRLNYLIKESAIIAEMKHHVTGEGLFRLEFPETAEFQRDWWPTPREAIDAMMFYWSDDV